MGRYQQRKEQGAKRMNQRMERPKFIPSVVSRMKKARQARTLRNRVTQFTEEQRTVRFDNNCLGGCNQLLFAAQAQRYSLIHR